MHLRRLDSLDDLEDFQSRFFNYSGVNIPIDYYRQSIVMGFFDQQHTLIGGYATAHGSRGRWLSLIPDLTRLDLRYTVDRTLELNSVWLQRRLHGSSTSSDLWIALGHDLARRPVDHIIFGANARRRGLVRLYTKIAVGILYEGPLVNSSLASARFYYSTPERFAILPQLYAPDLQARVNTGRTGRGVRAERDITSASAPDSRIPSEAPSSDPAARSGM